MGQRAAFLRCQERRSQRAVADVATRQPEALRQLRVVDRSLDRHLLGDQRTPELLAHLFIGERERHAVRQPTFEGRIDRVPEVGREDRDALERIEPLE